MRVALLALGFLALTATGHALELYPQGRPARAARLARPERAGILAREAPPIPPSRVGGREDVGESSRTPSTQRTDYGGAGGQSVRIPIGR